MVRDISKCTAQPDRWSFKINFYFFDFDSSRDATEYDDAKHDAAAYDGTIWSYATHDDTNGSHATVYGSRTGWHANDAATTSDDGTTASVSSRRTHSQSTSNATKTNISGI